VSDLLTKTSGLNPSSVGRTADKGMFSPESLGQPTEQIKNGGFSKALEEKLKAGLSDQQVAKTTGVKFSNHAIERMQARGIRFSQEQLDNISSAVTKAAQKGAKETLVLTDENALIVSIKNNTVVTVMDKAMLKDNVFTNIDSTVVL
jgi:flagellar operon protein